MIYYLTNLILFKQFNVATLAIKKQFLKMKQCSDLFKANVRRLQAFVLVTSVQNPPTHDSKRQPVAAIKAATQVDYDKCDRCLKRAEKYFKRPP